MKTKTQTHTPGPWTTEGHMGEYWHIGNKNESPILTILCKREEAPVNARLIAASPDMIAALKRAAEIIKTARQYFPKSIKHRDRFALELCNAEIGRAICKAEEDK